MKHINDDIVILYINDIVYREVVKHIEKDFGLLGEYFKKAGKESEKLISPNLIEQTNLSHLFEKIDSDFVKGKACAAFDEFLKVNCKMKCNTTD